MAETTAPTPAASAPKPAPAAKQPAAKTAPPPATPAPTGVTRREFLFYVWGASMALFLAETAGISVLFALPRFREGQFGGLITVNASDFPKVSDPPVADNEGMFWMVTTDKGILANYKVCTHLGCIYAWDNLANRFACPCHGSQFQKDGTWIAGPAPRSLDKFAMAAYTHTGQLVASSDDGSPMPLPPSASIVKVDTGKRILGKSHF